MQHRIGLLLSFLLLRFMAMAIPVMEGRSPDGTVQFSLITKEGGLYYSVSKSGRLVLEEATINFIIDGEGFGSFISRVKKRSDKTYRTAFKTRGTHSEGLNWYREQTYRVERRGRKPFDLVVRIYNDGLAYRYRFTVADSVSIDEKTRFRFPSSTRLWMQEDIKYYEGMYHMQVSDSVKAGKLIGPPLVIDYGNGLYAALTEVDLEDYAGMALAAKGGRSFETRLSGNTRRVGLVQSPWRLLMTGSLNELVNNDLMANLSSRPDPGLFKRASDWIKPGLSVWSWLTDYNVASKYVVGYEDMKQFSKWAGELGIPYNLVDDGWNNWKDGEKDSWAMMKDLVRYSAEQGVKVWLWKAYPDFKGIEGINTPHKMQTFFRRCAEVGVVGVKIDFFNHEGQEINRFYRDALKEAASYKIMVNFHGANKPTGLQHQFPNEMSREGIQGNEYGPNSRRAVVLPFTRLLVGPGDYTPLILSRDNPLDTSWRQKYHRDMTAGASWCFQIATTLLFSSPILCLSASPTDIVASGQQEFITGLPVEWDETRVLEPSAIGDVVVMARRKGSDWYLVAVTEKPIANLIVPLDFLGQGEYSGKLLRDDPSSATSLIESGGRYSSTNSITISLRAQGGFVARFRY
ncbi:glycoside hydrolase family 97 protein [Flavihumibacter sp. UBA7668]|uniref:glycoside hydrolase family 97 protein n=1 Tax=Flavihumibacter sp. UBA7668 TaxID=1946542 RepID=UPI0025C12EDA|nr:glycoside hydrolase family 97 protein [Flavihumibacter sp. UBA7668]